MRTVLTGAFALMLASAPALASDWPQFMRSSEHTGDAADEALALPLGLVAQVKLDDAVMTSPAVVGGLAFVVDQMGTAYCVDPKAGKVVWKAWPDGDRAMGFNTSSPCVAKGRVYYGTTAGSFHILDCKDGKVVKTVSVGSPIISAPTFANDSIYFQALDAVLRCLDLDGNEKWTWDHYKRYVEPAESLKKRGFPGGWDRPNYGGGDVAVSGTKVVTSFGWDLVCLEDKGKSAELAWCRRGRGGMAAMSPSICGAAIYVGGVEADGALGLLRLALADGEKLPKGAKGIPVQWTTAAARGTLVTTRESSYCKDVVCLFDCERPQTIMSWMDEKMATPSVTSNALAGERLVMATLRGDLIVQDFAPKPKAGASKFRTPSGKGIGSSPAVSGGMLFFGCDDGCLYVLGPDGKLEPRKDAGPAVCEPRSKVVPATGKAYGWIATAGNQQGTNFADDPALAAPLRLRWATRAFGDFKTPAVATADGDVITITLSRTVTCQEQATGRLRWRVRLPLDQEEWGGSAGLLAEAGRVYVPVVNNRSFPQKGRFYCLDQQTGAVVWSDEIGGGGNDYMTWSRPSPVLAVGKVAFASNPKDTKQTVIQAWDAATGAPAWKVELGAPQGISFGVTDGKAFYYSAAPQYNGPRPKGKPAETVAVEAATGKVLWRTGDFASGLQIALQNERLYMFDSRVVCLGAGDGKPVWTEGVQDGCGRYLSIGPDYHTLRGYGGASGRASLADGKPVAFKARGAQLGGNAHACGPVTLTPKLAVSVTVAGLSVRDAASGEQLWLSPGFAPRGCANPSVANGRVFWPSAANGMIFCWEPEK